MPNIESEKIYQLMCQLSLQKESLKQLAAISSQLSDIQAEVCKFSSEMELKKTQLIKNVEKKDNWI